MKTLCIGGKNNIAVAVYNNNFEMAKYMLELGAKATVVNNHGTTLLMYAKDAGIRIGDWSMFRWLTDIGVPVHGKDYSGKELREYLTDEQLEVIPDDIRRQIIS